MDSMVTCTAPAPTRQHKPRSKTPRTARLVVPPIEGHAGVLRLSTGNDHTDYVLQRLAADFGTAYRLDKVDGPEEYNVNLDHGERSTCECLGFLAHGRCKHVEALQVLTAAGRL
jgi:hypothetical protein